LINFALEEVSGSGGKSRGVRGLNTLTISKGKGLVQLQT